jgi:sec-independent protein translocase protein TatB
MFELGMVEIVIIGVIALVVLGPERLPKAARFVGLWVRKARAQWFAVKSELERELAVEEMKAAMEREGRRIRNTVDEASEHFNEATQSLDDAVLEARKELPSATELDPAPSRKPDGENSPPALRND